MKNGIKYGFTTKVWTQPPGVDMCWHFVSLPKEMAKEIRENLKFQEEGWGRMKATAQIGGSEWQTAIWFDTKHNTYLLPIKAAIRKKENIGIGKEVEVSIWI